MAGKISLRPQHWAFQSFTQFSEFLFLYFIHKYIIKYLYHQLKIYNTRYLLYYLQNTLRYYKSNITSSKISCLPPGLWEEKKQKAKLHRTILKKKIRLKGDLVAA